MTAPLLAVDKLEVVYQRAITALQGISLTVAPGQIVGILGTNGAGKSTFCLTLNGLIPHFFHGDFRGKVEIDGVNTRDVPVSSLITRVGVLFQNPFEQLTGVTETVHEEVAFGPENLGLPPEETLRRVSEALAAAGGFASFARWVNAAGLGFAVFSVAAVTGAASVRMWFCAP